MRVQLVDPSAYTPPYDHALAAALARAGADVELVTSRFLYGPVPREDGYRVEQYDRLADGMGYDSLARIARGADCLAILVEHDSVKAELAADRKAIEAAMRSTLILRFYVPDTAGPPRRA